MKKRCFQRTDKMQGFTLLELMIVLAVISILTVVTVPKYQSVKTHYRLQASAQTVVSELGYAKQYAMDYRKKVSVLFQEDGVTLVDENGAVIALKSFEPGVKFDFSRNSWFGGGLTFDKKGFNAQTGTIVLTHTSGRTVGVKIQDKTGYLTVVWP